MARLVIGDVNPIKFFKFLFVIPVITLIIIFQTSLQNRYLMASDIRDGETIFKNVCAGCHVKGGSVVLKGSKSLKLSDLEKRGIADIESIAKIANDSVLGVTNSPERLNIKLFWCNKLFFIYLF